MLQTMINFAMEAISKVSELATWLTTPKEIYWWNVEATNIIFDVSGHVTHPTNVLTTTIAPPIYVIVGGLVATISVFLVLKIFKNVWDAIPVV